MNPSAESLFGVSERQALGRPLAELAPGSEDFLGLLRRALDSGDGYGQTLSLAPGKGERPATPVSCRVSPLPDTEPGRFLVEILDASHWRQLDREQTLLSQHGASQRMIRQLAHEIRNPLGGLRGAAQLLERELDSATLREYTRVIIGEADRLAALTGRLLRPIREPRPERVNIHEVVERVRMVAAGDAPPALGFARDYDPSLPPVRGDRDQLIQALLNVVRNAMAAAGPGGHVVFRTRALTGYKLGDQTHRLVASIEIEDDGPGVPKEIEDAIFYPLVTGTEGGTGLGLPLAQDLVNRNGGLIEFESGPGRTVFSVRLPLEA